MIRLKWIPFEGPYKYAVVVYNYQTNLEHHLKVLVGDIVFIVKQNAGWYVGYNCVNSRVIGLVPKSYVTVIENSTFPHVSEDLRYWIEPINQLFVNVEDTKFETINRLIEDICDDQRRLQKEKLTGEDLKETQRKLAFNIAKGQKLLSLPVTVRNSNFKPIEPLEVTSVQLYKSHVKLQEDIGAGALNSGYRNKDCFSIQVKVSEMTHNQLPSGARIELIGFLISTSANPLNMSNTSYSRISLNSQQTAEIDGAEIRTFKPLIFTDLQAPSPDTRILLVFQVVRIGVIDLKKNSQPNKPLTSGVRRPYGVTVFDISNHFGGGSSGTEMKSYSSKLYGLVNESSEFLDSILLKLIGGTFPTDKSERGVISIEKISTLSSNFSQLQESPQWRHSPIARCYSIKSEVSWSQNMLHITLINAATDKIEKIAEKNMEVRIMVMDSNKKSYNFCDLSDKMNGSVFASTVYYHSDNPRFMETFSIMLPDRKSPLPDNLHLKILFKHRSMTESKDLKWKPYGVAYLKLCQDSCKDAACLLTNQQYLLKIHRIQDQKKIEDMTYLSNPQTCASQENLKPGKFSIFANTSGVRDVVCVETLLCSTIHTNNEHLYKLLNWKNYKEDLINILSRHFINPQYVNDTDLKRFSKPVLSALLEILSSSEDKQVNNSVFRALIRYFDFHNLKSVYSDSLLEYLGNEFQFSNIHNLLLDHLTNELKVRHSPSGGGSNISQKAFNKISWFFKIVVKSRQYEIDQYASPTVSEDDRNAKEYQFNVSVDMLMQAIFDATGNQNTDEILLITVYKNIGDIIDDLLEVYSSEKLTKNVLDLVEYSSKVRELSKENLLSCIINSKLFSNTNCRSKLLTCLTGNVVHFFHSNFRRTCDKLVSNDENMAIIKHWCEFLLNFIARLTDLWRCESQQPLEEIWCVVIEEAFLLNVIEMLIQCLLFVAEQNEVNNQAFTIFGRTLCTVFITLLHEICPLWPRIVQSSYIAPNYPPQMDCGGVDVDAGPLPACSCSICLGLGLVRLYDFISQMLMLFQHMCVVGLFPGGGSKTTKGQVWIDMLLLQSKEMIHALGEIFELALQPYYMNGKINVRGFILHGLDPGDATFSQVLIGLLLQTICEFFSQNYFIEDDSLVAARQECKLDQLWTACDLLHRLWIALGEFQKEFIAAFMRPILKMALIQMQSIREVTVRILFNMMSLDIVTTEQNVVSELDSIMEEAGENFVIEMESLIRDGKKNQNLRVEQSDLVDRLCKQMRVLLEYANYVNDESKINGMLAINNIRNYYQSIGRDDMYLRYLYKLLKLHKECNNSTERGQTLRVISEQLQWSETPVQCEVSDEYKDCQTQMELKEKICQDSLECLKANDWELAIEVCTELVHLYREVAPNYEKLSKILDCQAQLYQKIVSNETYRPSFGYFLIRYYGDNYPTFISGHEVNKDEVGFIYRTSEKLGDVMNMLMKQFPGCRILTSQKPKPGSDKQIFVGGVIPVPVLPHQLVDKKINPKIRKYYDTNEVTHFTFVRNLTKTENVTEMRTEASEYEIKEPLPGVLSMVPVIKSKRFERNPFETAIYTLKNELLKLRCKLEDYEENDKKSALDFVGSLRGTVDAAVGGGLLKYLDLIAPEDINPELSNNNDTILAKVMLEFLELQYQCLGSWNHQENEKELKEHLIRKFEENADQLSLTLDFDTSHLDGELLRLTLRSKMLNNMTTYRKQSVSTLSSGQQSTTTLPTSNGTLTRSSIRQSMGNYSRRDSVQSDSIPSANFVDLSSVMPGLTTPTPQMNQFDGPPPEVPKRPDNLVPPSFSRPISQPSPTHLAISYPPLPPRGAATGGDLTVDIVKPPLPPRTPRHN